MDKRSIALFAILFFSFSALGIFAARMGEQGPLSGVDRKTPVKKFRAKPGTERENARALIGSTPSLPSDSPNSGGGRDKPLDVWGRIAPPEEQTDAERQSQRVARAAINSLDPEEGIARIEKYLEGSGPNTPVSSLYIALAKLEARTGNVEEDTIEQAFKLAVATARNEADKVEAYYHHAEYLLQHGQSEKAVSLHEKLPPIEENPTPRRLEVEVMMGVAHERQGNITEAMAAYERAMDTIVRLGTASHEQAANVYRQAGLHLVDLYRKQGNESEAKNTLRHMKSWLRN